MTTDERPELGHLHHKPECNNPRVIRRETAHRHYLECSTCHAWASTPRRAEWSMTND